MTRRPSPSGRRERSVRTQKDDETVKGTSVFGKAFSFAGGRRNGDLGQLDKPSPTVSQKERRDTAQRERLQIFRGSGLATRRCSAGIRGGEPTQCAGPSARLCRPGSVPGFFAQAGDSRGQLRWRPKVLSRKGNALGRIIRLAAGGSSLRRRTSRKRKREARPQGNADPDCGRG